MAREGVSPANFLDWREQARSFAAVAAAEQWGFTLTDYGEPEAMRGSVVTKGFFEILGTNALVGRTLLPEEYEQNAQVVVISHGLWQRRFRRRSADHRTQAHFEQRTYDGRGRDVARV